MGEKTEKATPKKLKDARKKGQVAKSQDIPAAATFIASIYLTLFMSPFILDNLKAFFISTYTDIKDPRLYHEPLGYIIRAAYVICVCSFPIIMGVALVGFFANFLMIGPLFSTEVFKFDIKKFDPINNLKQKFKLKTLLELVKSLVKIAGVSLICYRVWLSIMPNLKLLVGANLDVVFWFVLQFFESIVIRIGFFFVVVALADYLYQKRNFSKEMMMEKFELKQEFKSTEGDPEIKNKRREIAREIAYGGGVRGVQGSKVLITNPTHIAVALAYEYGKVAAPFVLTKASGNEAEWLIYEAKKLEIPVVRNVPLAWKLYEEVELYSFIPVDTYEAVADILRWISSISNLGNQKEQEYYTES